MATTAALTENSRQGINSKIPHCIGLEAWLSRNLRPGCGHAYDETPVGLVVYVRNDPVNFIDPDGRETRAVVEWEDAADIELGSEGYSFRGWLLVPRYGLILGGGGPVGGDRIGGEAGWNWTEPQQTLQGLLNDQGKLLNGLIDRAKAENGLCRDFVNKVIDYLSASLEPDFTIGQLFINILTANRQIDPKNSSAHTDDNTIYVPTNAEAKRGFNDLWSTLIHEGFHLAMNTIDKKQLKDGDIMTAVGKAAFGENYVIRPLDMFNPSAFNSEQIGRNCGPGLSN